MAIDVTSFMLKPDERITWSRELAVDMAENDIFTPLKGTTNNAIIKTSFAFDDPKARTAIISFKANLRGSGTKGEADTKDNTDKLQTLYMGVEKEIIKNGLESGDLELTDGTVLENWRREAKDSLGEWAGDRMARYAFARLTHDCTNIAACSAATGLHAANNTTGIGAGDIFSLDAIDAMLDRISRVQDGAGNPHPKVRPYASNIKNVDGLNIRLNHYVYLAHPAQVRDLNLDPRYQRLLEQADVRGNNNRLMSGESAIYRGVHIIECGEWSTEYAGLLTSEHPDFEDSGNFDTYRGAGAAPTALGLLLGATAAINPMETAADFQEEPYDHNWKLSVAIKKGFTLAKTRYTGKKPEEKKLLWHGKDYGVMLCASILK